MNLQGLIKRNFATVGPYEGVNVIKPLLIKERALVVRDEDRTYGLLTLADVARHSYKLVIDCLEKKPFVTEDSDINHVVELLVENQHEALPVVNDSFTIVGIIFGTDVLSSLNQLFESNRQQIYHVAHDLKGPISNIKALNSMFDSTEARDLNEIARYLNISCDTAMQLIEDLMETSKLENCSKLIDSKEIRVNDMLHDAMHQYKALANEKDVNLIFENDASELWVKGDKIKLSRVMSNLIQNALKFTNSGKKVQVGVRKSDNFAEIFVKDEGIGIPENLYTTIFEKFSGAVREGVRGEKSSGLGLYISKKIVDMHNGRIEINSEENVGTTVSVFLPLISIEQPA